MAGSLKILLVEDNPQIVQLYSTVLSHHNYDFEVSMTVDDALEKAKSYEPDIIFLDIMLPGGKSGIDALMLLRTKPEYKCQNKKIVMLTNLGLTDKLEKAWEEYADGYVIKAEIVPHDLLEIIDSLLPAKK